ncbi:MAG: hypothetical protein IJV03_03110 [Alphaproteobacteria bacterium]|nr:hypothetical protein [Alphaproteobacteria bacterium]
MIVSKSHFYNTNTQRGASVLEVMLAITVVLAVSPFVYTQTIKMANDVRDIANANKIVSLRDGVINYIRINQGQWPDTAEIKMSEEDIEKIAPSAHSGFIDKYSVNGATITDVYLAFDINDSGFRSANVAKYIGDDAAIVREDGIAYSQNWAVSAPDNFMVGDLIYKISRDFGTSDKSKFLHRGTMGEDKLNQMQRDLHMNSFNMYNVSNIDAVSVKIFDVDAVFIESDMVDSENVYFTSGANLDSQNITFGSMRVTGDASGLNSIVANKLNGDKYTTTGRIIADRAVVGNSVNVANNLVLKSTSANTISGFNGISTNKLLTPYLSATDLVFYENFGITVSGELLMTSNAPLRIGNWLFPTNVPPSFSKFILTRASIPPVPDKDEFKKITSKNWQTR